MTARSATVSVARPGSCIGSAADMAAASSISATGSSSPSRSSARRQHEQLVELEPAVLPESRELASQVGIRGEQPRPLPTGGQARRRRRQQRVQLDGRRGGDGDCVQSALQAAQIHCPPRGAYRPQRSPLPPACVYHYISIWLFHDDDKRRRRRRFTRRNGRAGTLGKGCSVSPQDGVGPAAASWHDGDGSASVPRGIAPEGCPASGAAAGGRPRNEPFAGSFGWVCRVANWPRRVVANWPSRAAAIAALTALTAVAAFASPARATRRTPRASRRPRWPRLRSALRARLRAGSRAPTASLLGRLSSAPVNVVVKLDYDALATYAGGVPGLAATSPAATGRRLDLASPAAPGLPGLRGRRRRPLPLGARGLGPGRPDRARACASPTAASPFTLPAEPGRRPAPAARRARRPARRAPAAAGRLERAWPIGHASSGQLATTAPPAAALPGNGGRGVIVADIDTGVWPEHPMLADDGHLSTPPPTADGHARPCAFGNDVTKPGRPHFTCNDKLIGGRAFMDAYDALIGGGAVPGHRPRRDRPRHPHRDHGGGEPGRLARRSSASTAGPSPASRRTPTSWPTRCAAPRGASTSDSVAAIGQAIADGADVINYSISGGVDPVHRPGRARLPRRLRSRRRRLGLGRATQGRTRARRTTSPPGSPPSARSAPTPATAPP